MLRVAQTIVRVSGVVAEAAVNDYDFINERGERVQGVSRKIHVQNGATSIVEIGIPRTMSGAIPPEGTVVDLDCVLANGPRGSSLSIKGDHVPYPRQADK
jgi:hypothetical protein